MIVPAHILAVGAIVIGALSYDPQILTLHWQDGHEERIPATSPATCESAVRAVRLAIWPVDRPIPDIASCAPGNGFAPDAGCIHGFNCNANQGEPR